MNMANDVLKYKIIIKAFCKFLHIISTKHFHKLQNLEYAY